MSVGAFFKKTLPNLALAVASGVPGPIGAVAQIVNSVIPPAPGAKPIASTSAAIEAAVMGATPEQLASLKQADQDFAIKWQQLGIQSEQDWLSFVQADNANARNMQVQTRSKMPAWLALAAVSMLLFCIGIIAFYEIKPTGRDAFMMVLGAVVALNKDLYGYVFGSSANADKATELLSQAPPVEK